MNRRFSLLLWALLLPSLLWAASPAGLVPVRIHLESHDDVYRLHSLGLSIEGLSRNVAEAMVSPAQLRTLKDLGWRVEEVKPSAPDPKIVQAYHDYDWLTAKLDSVHSAYPGITRKISIGKSVENRDLLAFLVSDNPDSAENEAELRIAATIHGNEPVGTELCIAMIDSLTQAYGSVPEIASLVDNREIWFLPMFNPDGNAANTRYNAFGTDLNRNYPVPDGSIGDDGTYELEPENQAMMDWVNSRHFVLGWMYHGGALVANYHWDFSDSLGYPLPDHHLIREISLGYARLNSPMYNETDDYNYDGLADSGVVFGYYWYQVKGTLQDWSYYTNSMIDITLEIGYIKKPSASSLPTYWSDNRQSMLALINKAGQGIQGLVTDSVTGQPLNNALVSVAGNSKSVYSDTAGDYHRLLLSGIYDFSFSKAGYVTKTVNGVRVNYDSLTNLNVALAKEPVGGEGTASEIICRKDGWLKTWPNPLRGSVTASFQLETASHCRIAVYNAAGQTVRTLLRGGLAPGIHQVQWDGHDAAGRNTASGIYYLILEAGGNRSTGKLVKLK
jgi:hypothetical protein